MEDNILDDIREEDEVSASSETEDTQRKILYGKNGHRWATSSLAVKKIKNAQENIIIHLPGRKNDARSVGSIRETWNLFITDELVEKITTYTNQEINRQKMKYKSQQFYF
ncbi:hypothetical protein MML48_4g00005456 [Holotrichia oblita]|uniref:Uncharacterized protein n=1 Tax=Holotrichia oblita TaxID=644536 RepID=A0ACB9TAA4_HOLOL|nr:hypothetical protein MML48_4g00005456 [Holotrichia oblita]